MNTYWTTAMTGMNSSQGVIRSEKNSMSSPSATVPNAKLTMPAVVAATGSTIFGNWICLISWSWLTIETVASVTDAENHFQGRIAEKMKSG